MTDEARQALHALKRDEIETKIQVHTYELNLLVRFARAAGINVGLDFVDRADHTELVIHTDDPT